MVTAVYTAVIKLAYLKQEGIVARLEGCGKVQGVRKLYSFLILVSVGVCSCREQVDMAVHSELVLYKVQTDLMCLSVYRIVVVKVIYVACNCSCERLARIGSYYVREEREFRICL